MFTVTIYYGNRKVKLFKCIWIGLEREKDIDGSEGRSKV